MSEYIKRSDVLDLIDKGYLISNGNYEKEKKLINKLPSADVVEVVRCKDCKFWDSDCIWCNLWGNTQEYGNGYCSYGERKDNE